MRHVFFVLMGCLSLPMLAQGGQPYLFYTLRTLVQAEQELGRGQNKGAEPLMQWLHDEQHRLLLQVAGTPDARVQNDILEIETVLREVQSLTGLRYALVVSEPPGVFATISATQLAEQEDSWLAEKLTTALAYAQALRTLAPSLDWHIVSLTIWPSAAVAAQKPPAPVGQPAVSPQAEVQARGTEPKPVATAAPAPTPRPAADSGHLPQVSIPVPAPAKAQSQTVAALASVPLPAAANSPEAIRLGLTRARRPYTRMAPVLIAPANATARSRDSLGTAKLETITLSLETVQPDAQVVIDTVASWVIRQTAARFAALQNLQIDSLGCQTQINVQGFAAGTLTNFAEITLREVQASFSGFGYATKAQESNKNKRVTLSGSMTCYGLRPAME